VNARTEFVPRYILEHSIRPEATSPTHISNEDNEYSGIASGSSQYLVTLCSGEERQTGRETQGEDQKYAHTQGVGVVRTRTCSDAIENVDW